MKTNDIQQDRPHPSGLDLTDRKLLRLLAEQVDQSYAELGKKVHLSAPAVHERVKRLTRDGFIEARVAKLNGTKIGCPLLAFIHVATEGWGLTEPVLDLRQLADVEEIHTAAGDISLILKVRCSGPSGLEALLSRIQGIKGVRITHSYVVLGTYLERGPMPDVSTSVKEEARSIKS